MNKSNFYTKLILVSCALFFQFAHAKNTTIPPECNISQIANSPTLVDELADIYNQAINQNNVSAQYQLYEKGKGWSEFANCWLGVAANNGNTDAQTRLAYNYLINFGKNADLTDFQQAEILHNQVLSKVNQPYNHRLIRRNAKTIADYYLQGKIVPKNLQKAFDIYFEIAKANVVSSYDNREVLGAMFEIAQAYHYGNEIIEKNIDKATMWYGQIVSVAEEADNEFFYLSNAIMYEFGLGVPNNYNKSFEYYFLAAIKGSTSAKYKMHHLYANGIGVKKDLDNANAWLESAKMDEQEAVK
ncbi:tetratricopeptide repeat protein [Moraxella pluranimalium]|uniref:Sel1 repeat family protein n=1 Tax=Moraxella pluranimalium TaxID=470453 RepID=A0A1T0CUF7_9GAMM|nr:tetratricopeptide repeat protein [Moraxella pluranimalium]OOS25967.1 hypothetical protein B0680_01000 [Moraxella pluranimalium]